MAAPVNAPAPVKVSERFSSKTASTVTFVSCDNTRFYIEREKLDRAADFVPPQDLVISPTELVPLTEDATTLDLLFRFVNCEVYVNLDVIPFKDVARLAEAADKYLVYSAMAVCHIYMKVQHKAHPLEVMQYAARHEHHDILDAAAPYTIGSDLRTMFKYFSPSYVISWVLFNDKYQQLARRVASELPKRDAHHWDANFQNYHCALDDEASEPGFPPGGTWIWIQREVSHALITTGGRALLALDTVFTPEMTHTLKCCEGCRTAFRDWRMSVVADVGEIKAFTTFLNLSDMTLFK